MGNCLGAQFTADSPAHCGPNNSAEPAKGKDVSQNGSSNGSGNPAIPNDKDHLRRSTSSNLRAFSFSDLKAATRNFRPDSVLGEGGFGCVFKGWIDEQGFMATRPGTGIVIAVKKLNLEGLQGHKEWLAEVHFLGQLHHANLVRLIGYCAEDDHRLLVYEFMPRGSLENHLFRRSKSLLGLPGVLLSCTRQRDLSSIEISRHQTYYWILNTMQSYQILGLQRMDPLEITLTFPRE